MLGLAEIESMASGTPVICSRLGGLAEMVRHGETGFLVEPGNVAELRDRIRAVLAGRRPARCLGDRSGAFSPPPPPIRRVARDKPVLGRGPQDGSE